MSPALQVTDPNKSFDRLDLGPVDALVCAGCGKVPRSLDATGHQCDSRRRVVQVTGYGGVVCKVKYSEHVGMGLIRSKGGL